MAAGRTSAGTPLIKGGTGADGSGKLCNADGSLGVKLVYIDPPFATKKDFSGTQDQKAYQDKIAGATFIEFLRKRLVLLREKYLIVRVGYQDYEYRKIYR